LTHNHSLTIIATESQELDFYLELDFNTTNVEESGVFNDFAYIQTNHMNCFVVSSSSDYKVAIVDMDTLEVSYVTLKDIPYEGRGRSRQVEWAEGTKYVWIGGRSDDEAYVIDLETKELVNTFSEVDPRKLLSVTNHHFMGMADEFGAYFSDNNVFLTDRGSNALSFTSNSDKLSIAALALSCVAIAAVLASFFVKSGSASGSGKKVPAPEAASAIVPPSVN